MAWHGGIPVRRNRKFVLYLIAACLALLIVSFRSLVLSHSSQIDNHHTDEQSAIQFHETIDATGTSVSEPNSAQFRPASDAASTLSVETTTIANGECGRFSNADDVLMILKTGVTVAHKRLPAHLKGTFRCTPKYLIFSDFSETINSHRIHNVFEAVDLAAQLSMPEFELYSFLQENPNRLSEVLDDPSHSTNGWRLDRWKFLPLLQKTWEAYQEAKWYLIIEGDTAVVWSNLLRWLSTLDSKEPIYLGLSQEVGPHHFALGGTGIILSRAALQRAVEWIPSRLDDYNQFTQAVMYGDITLGRVFEDAGITLRNGGSLFESNSISSVAYSPTTWCRPFVTMHHMQPDEIYSLWEVEQQLLNEKISIDRDDNPVLHHDVFNHLVRPLLVSHKDDWDNFSFDEQLNFSTSSVFEDCHRLCVLDVDCMQFRYASGKCWLSKDIRLGRPESPQLKLESGWMIDRIEKLVDMSPCERSSENAFDFES